MIILKMIRKIGKMLRGGAGKKEIFLGALCGVLIGFNPVAGLTLFLAILLTLLLNANMGFALLSFALGKMLSLMLAAISFNTGYFIIHKMGLEGLFTTLVNAPVTALMGLDIYAMIGGLPYAIIIGILLGKFFATTVTKIREQMVKAGGHEKVGKAIGNKFSRFLLWLAFGKQKISTADVLEKQSPLLRKSGIILMASVLVIGLLLEFFLMDVIIRKGLEAGIAAETRAEVNVEKVHLSPAGGELQIIGLQITDPDKPTHNLIQIDRLTADISMSDILRKTYAIDLLAGSTLKHDVPRNKPGKLYPNLKEEKEEAQEEQEEKTKHGQQLGDYFAKAKNWEKYGRQAYDYLKQRKENAETIAKEEQPKPSRKTAQDKAQKHGYLKAAADLVSTHPKWLIRQIQIEQVQLANLPLQTIQGSELSSHPELNGKPTSLELISANGNQPTARVILRFDNPAENHNLSLHLSSLDIGGTLETSDAFPLNLNQGKADLHLEGPFSVDELDLPFSILVHNLKADMKEGQSAMGLDPQTASQILSSMEQIEIDGSLEGTLLSPRVKIDYDKLTANLRNAAKSAGKKILKDKAGEELNKALKGKDAEQLKDKAKNALKGLF